MDLMDLIEEGNIGLLIAIDHYDPSLNFRFSTYATWWIKQAVTRALETKSKPIRLPSKVYQLSLKIPKLKADFYMKNNREMTNLELANSLDISLEKLEVLLNAYNEPISLQNKFRSDDNDEEIIILVEDKETNVEEEALENLEKIIKNGKDLISIYNDNKILEKLNINLHSQNIINEAIEEGLDE